MPYVKYCDLLLMLGISQLCLLKMRKKKITNEKSFTFYQDNSLGGSGIDGLGYEKYASRLAEKILLSDFEKSFAIGINGKWGMGKTSFLDLVKRKVNSTKVVEIDFNPWNTHTPSAIIKDFFDSVQASIRPYHSSLARLLIQYSNKLVELNSNSTTKSILFATRALSDFDSANSLYDEINKALKKIDKKLLVYIDDLDRLDKEEIIEVIRLIRNTANFYNTFFIVAYDRNYIVSALKEHNIYNREEFLEKIFQVEVTLPYFSKMTLRYQLAEKLKANFPEKLHAEIEESIIGSSARGTPDFLDEWLESMRDVSRLANTLFLNMDRLVGEVVFFDFMRMELLRVKYPSVYEMLFRRTSEFLETTGEGSEKRHYSLKEIDKSKDGESVAGSKTKAQTYFAKGLIQNHDELSVPLKDIDKILSMVNGVFDSGIFFGLFDNKSHLSIVYPSSFMRYFSYSLMEDNLSEVEFSNARLLSSEEFQKKIAEWVESGLEYRLQERFIEIKTFDDRGDYQKIITAIFYLANLPIVNSKRYSKNAVGYEGRDLSSKMDNYDNSLSKKYYEGKTEELQRFVRELFKQATPPFSFEAQFIHHLNNEFGDGFPLDKEELQIIVLGYLKEYCALATEWTDSVLDLFHACKITEWIPEGGNSYSGIKKVPEEAKQIVKDFVASKGFDEFLLLMVEESLHDGQKYAVNNFVLKIYDDWKNFESELLDVLDEEKSKYLKEFRKFYAQFASKNHSVYIDFNFKEIPFKSTRQVRSIRL